MGGVRTAPVFVVRFLGSRRRRPSMEHHRRPTFARAASETHNALAAARLSKTPSVSPRVSLDSLARVHTHRRHSSAVEVMLCCSRCRSLTCHPHTTLVPPTSRPQRRACMPSPAFACLTPHPQQRYLNSESSPQLETKGERTDEVMYAMMMAVLRTVKRAPPPRNCWATYAGAAGSAAGASAAACGRRHVLVCAQRPWAARPRAPRCAP